MLELNPHAFMRATNTLARINSILTTFAVPQTEILVHQSVAVLLPALSEFQMEAQKVGARDTARHVDRALTVLRQEPCTMTVGGCLNYLNEIELRFNDYMTDVQMFALAPGDAVFMQSADNLVEIDGFSTLFPNASFEVEESCKCLALGRYTAAVFHAMRMLEIGIRALAKRLDIPDPTRPSEKNWSKVLGAIEERINALWPAPTRMPKTDGTAFEALFATLDAVKNPWRNATMHVETIYAPHEALHIVRCAGYFMRLLSELTDEEGEVRSADRNEPPIPGLESGFSDRLRIAQPES
jgi:hypothetical protein